MLVDRQMQAGTTQVDFEVDRPPPADSPPGDLLTTMVKETVILYKKVSKSEKKWNLFISLIDLKVLETRKRLRDSPYACYVMVWVIPIAQ